MDRRVRRYGRRLQGPGSEQALNEAIDEVVPVLGERLTTSDIDGLRAAITKRHAGITAGLETTTSCAIEK